MYADEMKSVLAKEPSRKVQRQVQRQNPNVIRDSFLDVICAGRGRLDHLGMGNTMVETDALTGNISLSVD
jgi:hypothetical protein